MSKVKKPLYPFAVKSTDPLSKDFLKDAEKKVKMRACCHIPSAPGVMPVNDCLELLDRMAPVVHEAVEYVTNCHAFDVEDPCLEDCENVALCLAVCKFAGKQGRQENPQTIR